MRVALMLERNTGSRIEQGADAESGEVRGGCTVLERPSEERLRAIARLGMQRRACRHVEELDAIFRRHVGREEGVPLSGARVTAGQIDHPELRQLDGPEERVLV